VKVLPRLIFINVAIRLIQLLSVLFHYSQRAKRRSIV